MIEFLLRMKYNGLLWLRCRHLFLAYLVLMSGGLVGEKEIKSLLLNHLLASGDLHKDGLVFSEMSLAKNVRRLDLGYVEGGKMIALEIKSEKDTLSRLAGQIEEYCKYFDKVVVAVAPKFVKRVEVLLVDECVGIWEVSDVGVRVIRKGRVNKGICKENYVDLMTRRELEILAKMIGVAPAEFGVYDLKVAVKGRVARLPKSVVKAVLVDGIEKRFRMASERFIKKVFLMGEVSPSDVNLLSPYKVAV